MAAKKKTGLGGAAGGEIKAGLQNLSAARSRQPIGGGPGGTPRPGGGRPTNPPPSGNPQQNPQPQPNPTTPSPWATPSQPYMLPNPGGYNQPGSGPFYGQDPYMWDPGRSYTGPSGRNLMGALFGGNSTEANLLDYSGVGSLLPGPNGGATNDPFYQLRSHLALQMLSGQGGVLGPTQALGDATTRSQQQFNQLPASRGDFDSWFGIGGAGQDFWRQNQGTGGLTPAEQLMGRMGSSLGYEGVNDAASTNIYQTLLGAQSGAQSDPYLDPRKTAGQARQLEAGYDRPDPNAWLAGMQDARRAGGDPTAGVGIYNAALQSIGNPGADLGAQGTRDVDATGNRAISELTRSIDQEAERSLNIGLSDVQNQMQAAGLGRSGWAEGGAAQTAQEILGQANRDKMRVLAEAEEARLGRYSQARNLETQVGAQSGDLRTQGVQRGLLDAMGIAGQGGLNSQSAAYNLLGQGLGAQAESYEGSRARETGLYGQQVGQYGQRYMSDMDRQLQALMSGEQMRQSGIGNTFGMQSDAMNQFLQLYGARDALSQQAMQNYLQTSEQGRTIQQDQLSGLLSMSMLPLDIMMRLSTGTSAPTYQPRQSSNPWLGQLGNIGGSAIGALLGNELGSGGYDSMQIDPNARA